jgi:uncharacterized protein (UPF0297 family)
MKRFREKIFSEYTILFLINMNHIKKFVRGDGGYILMNDDTQITIARSKREGIFFEMFSKFLARNTNKL